MDSNALISSLNPASFASRSIREFNALRNSYADPDLRNVDSVKKFQRTKSSAISPTLVKLKS
jgi:hypothetical protein